MSKELKDNIDIICYYIENKINVKNTPEENYQQLQSLKKNFENICVEYDIDLFISLFEKSQKLNMIVENIIDNKLINENDKFIQLILEAYIKAKYNEINTDTEDNMSSKDINTINLYIQEISKIPLLDIVEERKLIQLMKNGDTEARKILIECNLRLVVSIARKYINSGLSLQDLIQEGNIGLIEAADKFDLTKNTRFATYAHYWINQKIKLAILDTSTTIRISRYTGMEKKKLIRKIDELSKELKRKPTIEELSISMNLSEERIQQLLELNRQIVSINSLLPESEKDELSEFIPDQAEPVEDTIIKQELIEYIRTITFESDFLTERQKEVLKKRFGYNCNETSLEDIAKEFNITREAIRQIIINSIIKIIKFKGIQISKYLGNQEEMEKLIDQIIKDPKSFKMKRLNIPTKK